MNKKYLECKSSEFIIICKKARDNLCLSIERKHERKSKDNSPKQNKIVDKNIFFFTKHQYNNKIL